MENEKISVIITIYNIEKYLEKCLDSVIGQTYDNLEIILVDDGSTDGSASICDRYQEQDSRIRVIHKENEGLVRARKTGVTIATGKYIGYVDGDDWIDCDMYEKLYHNLIESDADIVAAGRIEEHSNQSLRCENIAESKIYADESLAELYSKMIFSGEFFSFGLYPTVWDKLFKSELLRRNQLQVPDMIVIGEDVACVYPCMLEAKRVCVLPDCFYHYRQHEGSMLRRKDMEYIIRVVCLYQYMWKRCKETDYWDILRPQIDLYLADLVVSGAKVMYGFNFVIPKENVSPYLFPFQKIGQGDRVVLYGAGKVGKIYYQQIRHSRYCKIVGWVDKEAGKIENPEYKIDFPIQLEHMNYDWIVVCVKSKMAAQEIMMELKAMGIDTGKIVWQDPVI